MCVLVREALAGERGREREREKEARYGKTESGAKSVWRRVQVRLLVGRENQRDRERERENGGEVECRGICLRGVQVRAAYGSTASVWRRGQVKGAHGSISREAER